MTCPSMSLYLQLLSEHLGRGVARSLTVLVLTMRRTLCAFRPARFDVDARLTQRATRLILHVKHVFIESLRRPDLIGATWA